MSSVLSTKPWLRDPDVVSIPWRQQEADEILHRASAENGSAKLGERPLKLGIYWTDAVVEPQPPIKRGLRMVVEAVQKAGHKVCIPFEFKFSQERRWRTRTSREYCVTEKAN